MVRDQVRCGAYARAIEMSSGRLRGGVVMDVGAGTQASYKQGHTDGDAGPTMVGIAKTSLSGNPGCKIY
eukprot:2432150-Amphidinium_carterae.1